VGPPDKGRATNNHSPEPIVRNRATGNQNPEPVLRESATAGVDQVRFSFDQTRVQSLQAQALAQPDVREAKVTGLQQAIAKGEYAVSASQVADAMVAELSGGSQS
jgi:flagellar biosynthesis anti-sigma factor FlgM